MKGCIKILAVFLFAASIGAGSLSAATLRGQWDFNNSANLTQATVGNALILYGSHTAAAGISAGDGAARIGEGSNYGCDHDVPANGGGTYVNLFSIVMDVKVGMNGWYDWVSLFNTSNTNANEGDLWIGPSGLVGVGSYYSNRAIADDAWYRIAVTHNSATSEMLVYCNGTLITTIPITLDGRWSLYTDIVRLFADYEGYDHTVDVSKVMVYEGVLTPAEVAALSGPGGTSIAEPPLTFPYLQDAKTNGMTIMWERATTTAGACTLVYGTTTAYGSTATYTTATTGFSTVYKAVITGLAANTTYHYKLTTAEGYDCGDRTFVTSPSTNIDFAFGVWSDSQDTYDATEGPYGDPWQPAKSMMQTMVSQGCKFGVTSGDLAWSGYEYSWIEASFTKRIQRYLGGSIPFYVAWGNHDGNQWALARNFISEPASNSNYSFNYAGCHFTCIDAADFNNFTWIANDLQAAQGSKFIFVFCHYPPYCERWYAGEAQYQAQLVPLLEQYNVNICFSGHTHEYERGLQGGVYYVITGGGSWLDYTEPLVYDWPHMTKGGYNDLDGSIDGGLINEFVRVNVTGSTLTCTLVAFNTDGTIYSQTLDTFNATPPPPLFSDGFESGNFTTGGWTRQNTNATVSTAAKYTGTYGSKLAGTTWIQKAISTAGKTNVHVKYKRKTAGMDSGENLYVEWSVNGTTWYNLETTRSTSWATQDKTCASGANNNANFRVRFRTNASAASSEYAYIDDVVITGQ